MRGGEKMKNRQGFTLIELLVVIAIIGILSSIAVVNLNSARDKAKVANVKGTLAGLIPAVILCHDAGAEIYNGATPAVVCAKTGAGPTIEAGTMCSTPGPDASWPTLMTGATYGTCNSDFANGTFSFAATIASRVITCTQNGCAETAAP